MAKWKLTTEDKKAMEALAANSDEKAKNIVKKATAKDELDLNDLKEIKNNLPPNVPVFAIFNKLTVSMDTPGAEYKASAEFRAKTEALRRRQENAAYKKMVESVDPNQKYGKVNMMENFGTEMKTANRQLMSIINVIITVVGAFFFGFTGITYAYPHLNLDLATRFLIGLVLGTIVFFADLYFVVKSMEEEIPDEEKSPYANSHNLNFREVAGRPESEKTESKEPKVAAVEKKKSAKAKKND